MKVKVRNQRSEVENLALVLAICRRGLCVFCLLIFCREVSAQALIRLAVLDLVGDERGEAVSVLRSLARQSESPLFELIEEDLTRLAARGVGYAGSLNLSRAEARALGQSLGCDFYLLGKVLVTRRAASGEQFYFDSLLGLFVVESRTGALILFDFERAQSPTEGDAHAQLKELVKRGWAKCANAIATARKKRAAEIENIRQPPAPLIEAFSDDLEAQGIGPPVFSQRLKPAYTEQADLAGVTATVELEAVFGESGRVEGVEVVRWAGFGLDESAMATVRKLSFKPAERDGKRVTIRGLVRYNFRRPHLQGVAPQVASPDEIERIRRSLRDLLSPGQSKVKPPNF